MIKTNAVPIVRVVVAVKMSSSMAAVPSVVTVNVPIVVIVVVSIVVMPVVALVLVFIVAFNIAMFSMVTSLRIVMLSI